MAARELDPQERLDWLRLCRTETIGPVSFYAMLRRFGSARAALDVLPRLARRGERATTVTAVTRAAAEAELAALHRAGARLVCWGEPGYPSALAAIDDAPPILTVLGEAQLLQRPMIAVVGARNASANGRRLARELAAELGLGGLVVISGLARGIDAAAHLGALETGSVAVVAGGADVIYPAENRGLYDALAHRGAIVAELPLGTEPQARHFPRRNRIISGMTLGVVVVEAAARSGSLITARFALEQGREVFAVPGSPLDPRARGCNGLLRHGATLTETAEDVLSQVAPQLSGAERLRPTLGMTIPTMPPPIPSLASGGGLGWGPSPGAAELTGDEGGLELILERLGPTPVAVDELVRQCQMSAAVVATLLLELELAGRVERHPGNLVSLR
ncbi:MAG TPA: DNA-processing protein DprA [Stellaceae bacterium]|nr:DNA-processing protein DprA [Stellaceae bacterium]